MGKIRQPTDPGSCGGLLLGATAGGAILGAVAGHAAAGMSRHDLTELGEHLDTAEIERVAASAREGTS